MALAFEHPEWFEYFLDPANHKPGIPIDMISYHCYANANNKQLFDAYEYTLFDKADNFLNTVSFIENIRKRLAPNTKTDIDELGTFVNDKMRNQPIEQPYWNLAAAVYAYFFIGLTRQGIDVIGESQLVGFPSQFPDVSLIDYTNNKPNARYWVLKLIKDNIKAGDTLVKTNVDGDNDDDFEAQGFMNTSSKKVLVINKRNRAVTLKIPAEFKGAKMSMLDGTCGDNAANETAISADSVQLKPFAVSLVTLNNP
jgi:hypothetical protein